MGEPALSWRRNGVRRSARGRGGGAGARQMSNLAPGTWHLGAKPANMQTSLAPQRLMESSVGVISMETIEHADVGGERDELVLRGDQSSS